MKKLSALLLAFAMMLTMLSVASADDVQVIRMWSNDQHDQSVIKEKIEAQTVSSWENLTFHFGSFCLETM